MALDKLIDSSQLDGALGSTADAIRAKTGETSSLTWDMDTGFAVQISEISTGIDTSDATATADDILDGQTAYADGEKIEGTIPTLTENDVSVSGKTVTIPVGKYTGASSATPVSKSVADGAYSASVSSHSVTTTPVVTGNVSGTITDISSTTAPSGTDGTDYWTITPSGSVTTTGVSTAKGKATIGTAGYIGAGNKETSASTVNITPTVSNGTPRYIPKANIGGSVGAISVTTTVEPGTVSVTAEDTPSGVTNAASGNATTTAPSSGVYVAVQATASPNNTGESTSIDKNGTIFVSKEGFVPSALTGSFNVTGTAIAKTSLKHSQVTYVPITEGSVTQNKPTINTSSGLITATSTATAGYVSSGTKSNTLQLSTISSRTYVPGTTDSQLSSGNYLTGSVTIKGDANLVASNIKYNTKIFNVTGTFTATPSGKSSLTAAALRSGYAGFINGYQVNGSMADTTVTEGTTTVSGTTATRGTWRQTAGYTTARTVAAATFANEATSGTTYVDISETTAAPVLVSGDYLYINKGYSDNLKISLAKLVPDGSDVKGHGEYLLSGHSAYDDDGTLVAGTIQTLAASDVTVDGKTVTIPTGKYTGGTAITKDVADGDYSASVTSASISSAPTYTPATSGTITNIATTTKPSGTDGTDYWTITPSGTKTDGNARSKATATISTAGYIAAGSKTTSSYTNKTITITENAGTESYIPKATMIGDSGELEVTTTVAPGTVSISKQSTPSGVTNAASGNATTTAPSSGVYVAVKATAAANTTGSTSTESSSGTVSVMNAGYAPTTLSGTVNFDCTLVAKTSAKDSSMTYVPITTASPAFDGGTLSGGSTATGTNVTLSTTDNGMKVQTAYTAASTAVLYNGAVNGWVTKADNAEALAAQSKSSTNGTAYYVTAVTMPKDKGFTVTTTADTALDTTSDLDVTNNEYRRVDVVNKPYATTLVNNGANNAIVWTTGKYLSTNGSVGSTVNVSSFTGNSSWKCVILVCTAGDKFSIYGKGGTTPRLWCFCDSSNKILSQAGDQAQLTHGEITAPANAAKLIINNNNTVVADPVIIKKSGTVNVTNIGAVVVTSASLGSGDVTISAYDTNSSSGTTSQQIVTNGIWKSQSVSASGTYYGRVTVGSGGYGASVSSHSVTTTPVVTGAISGTVTNIGTTTKPSSGTDGTDYWTITPGGSVTTTGVSTAKGKATINTAGYIATGNIETSGHVIDITPTVSNGAARYIVKGAITNNTSGGTSTATINRGSQIKIGAGYYPSDLYYTAQSNSGTLTITTSHSSSTNVSCNGKANVQVTGITVKKDGAFSLITTADTALDTTSDTTITNNAYRQVRVTNAANANTAVTNSGTTTVTSGSATAGNLTVSAYNSSGTAENDKSIVSAGKWVATSVTGSGTYYGRVTVGSGAYSASVSSHSVTTTPVVTGAISGTVTNIGTTTKPSSGTDGTDYWTIAPGGSVTTTGVSTAKGKATIGTAGYVGTGNTESSASTVNITPTVSNGTARYIVKGAITNNTSGGTSTATINRGSQIKIGTGYYPSDLYYTAQSNSGTMTIGTPYKSSTNISCDGYANVNIVGITVKKDSEFTLNVDSDTVLDLTSDISVYNASNRHVVLINPSAGTANISNSGITEYSNSSSSAGSLTVSAYNASNVIESSKSIVSGGKWVMPTVNGAGTYYGRVTIDDVVSSISGGGLSGTATASGSSCSISDSTNNSGVSITTACTASRAKVSCTASTAGWASGTIKELAADTGAMTAKTYYVNGVTLTKPSSGTRTFSVTVPNGSSTATFTFNVDASGNVTITES